MKIEGQCFCGEIAYEAVIDPGRVVICHCTHCQALSGSAFEVVAMAPADRFTLLSGTPRCFIKTADSGRSRQLAFCGNCGSRLYGADDSGVLALRVGTIRQRRQLSPRLQIWCDSALPWARYGGIPGIDAQTSD